MIILLTGKLGGGKTYWCVNYLIEKYYEYRQNIFQYVPIKKNLRIVSNIDKLELPHENLEALVDEKGLEGVFSKDFVNNDTCVFIIDEAQRPKFFHRKFYNPKVFEFFQMSRHYGVDVLMITQDVNSLSRELKYLCEYEIRAMPRSRRTQNIFVYQYLADDEVFKRQIIKFNKRIGELYRSQFRDESSKMPRVWKPYLVGACIAVVLVFFGFKYFIHMFNSMGQSHAASNNEYKKKLMSQNDMKSVGIAVSLPSKDKNDSNKVESSLRSQQSEGYKEDLPSINTAKNNKVDSDHVNRTWLDDSLEDKFKKDMKSAKAGNILKDASGRVSGYVLYYD